MALVTPAGQFMGIDFAKPAIERGQQRIRDLGLANVELHTLDLTEFPADAKARSSRS